jgi:hypothetical protein
VHGRTGILLKIPTKIKAYLFTNWKSREAGRLINDDDFVILIHNPHRGPERMLEAWRRRIARFEILDPNRGQ